MSLTFRWLGVAGVQLRAGRQVLALDPFFTRPTLAQMFHPVQPSPSLVAERLPICDVVLVTHAHYDHLLDVPSILQLTGAVAYGSANTCRLLQLCGVPEAQVKQVHVGDQLALGAFRVEVIRGQHSWIPFSRFFNGNLPPGIQPPFHVWDYRMDECLGYRITAMGTRLLVCTHDPLQADVLFAVAQESKSYYVKLFTEIQPRTFIPIHWDNLTRPLGRPLRRITRLGRQPLWQITLLARQLIPRVNVIIPEIFREYTLGL